MGRDIDLVASEMSVQRTQVHSLIDQMLRA